MRSHSPGVPSRPALAPVSNRNPPLQWSMTIIDKIPMTHSLSLKQATQLQIVHKRTTGLSADSCSTRTIYYFRGKPLYSALHYRIVNNDFKFCNHNFRDLGSTCENYVTWKCGAIRHYPEPWLSSTMKMGMSLNTHAQLTAVTMDTSMFIFCACAYTHVH